jgi:putative DNA primase/helicase
VIFVGSTNAKQFLSDDTGNRRFWPVEFNGADVDRDAIVRDRDQLWAEAVAAFDAGQRWHLEGAAENDMAGSRQAERMEVHPWLELLADYLESRVEVTVNELMQHAIPMEAAKREPRLANTIGGLMGRLGWVTKQVRRPGSKNPVRVWVPVTAEP